MNHWIVAGVGFVWAALEFRLLPRRWRSTRDSGAKRSMAEAESILRSCPDPGVLPAWLAALRPPAYSHAAPTRNGLSERELTVLRLMRGTLSERDIGRELYLSHNTVHSHVRSIFRKLGVSSRQAAIDRARELNYL